MIVQKNWTRAMLGNREEPNNRALLLTTYKTFYTIDSRESTKRIIIGGMIWELNRIRKVISANLTMSQ